MPLSEGVKNVGCLCGDFREGGRNEFFRLRLFLGYKLHAQTFSSLYRPFRRWPFGKLLETLTNMKYTMGALFFTYSPGV